MTVDRTLELSELSVECDAQPSPECFAGAILPGATLGVVGGGQLGRMFALAARRMGYRVAVWCDELGPATECADQVLVADYQDLDAGRKFFSTISAITFETEKLPVSLFHAAAKLVPVRPGIPFLEMSQNRIREKTGLQQAGLPVGPFHVVRSLADLEAGIARLGTPAILKTASGGYDGKGQIRIEANSDLGVVWPALGTNEAILEAFVPFVDEISVIAARDAAGTCVTYGPVHNTHSHHILDVSYCPVELPEVVHSRAIGAATKIAETFAVVGVFCVELFVLADGQVWVNEIAPRPHNSGHLTIEGHVTSQFEQQVRCLCGLPAGSAALVRPVAMANLLGDRWEMGQPDWERLAREFPDVQWHLYGKTEARSGRKMGHLTVTEDSASAAVAKVLAARTALTR